jgi:hypothetical protein
MDSLARLEQIEVGFGANQLQHSLMAGTPAAPAPATRKWSPPCATTSANSSASLTTARSRPRC